MSALYCLFLCSPCMSISSAVCIDSFSIFSLITYIICSDMHSQQLKRTVIMTSCGYGVPKIAVTGASHWVAVQGFGYGCLAKLSQASTHPIQPTGFWLSAPASDSSRLRLLRASPPPQQSCEMPSSLLKKWSGLGACSGLTGAVPHQAKAVGVETRGCQGGQGIRIHKLASQSLICSRRTPASPANTLSLHRCTSPWMLSALTSKEGLSLDMLRRAL